MAQELSIDDLTAVRDFLDGFNVLCNTTGIDVAMEFYLWVEGDIIGKVRLTDGGYYFTQGD